MSAVCQLVAPTRHQFDLIVTVGGGIMLSIALRYIGLFAVAIGVLLSAHSAPSAEDRFGDNTKSATSRRDDGGSRDRGASGDTGRGGGGGADSRGDDGGGGDSGGRNGGKDNRGGTDRDGRERGGR